MAERSDPWPTLTWLGVLCGIAVGAVIVMLIRREREALSGGVEPLYLPGSELDEMGLGSIPAARSRLPAKARPIPAARTLTVSSTSPTMVIRAAGNIDWTVWARTVGPSGSFATFIIGKETGNAVVVPAGQAQMMRLPRGEYLYAQGDMPGVCVSVSGGGEL